MAKNNSVNLSVDINADGFAIEGGTTARKLTVTGGNVNMTGGGAVAITFPTAAGTLATLDMKENVPMELLESPSADGKYSGIVIPGTAGATITFGDCVYRDFADGEWKLADASATATSGDAMIGICVEASTDTNPTTILLHGTIRADATFPTLTAGDVFISETAGDITSTAPSTTDAVVKVIGKALDGNTMYFNPDHGYITAV